MVVDWLCPGLRPSGNRRPHVLHCKVILLDEHELVQDVLVSRLCRLANEQTNWLLQFYNQKTFIPYKEDFLLIRRLASSRK